MKKIKVKIISTRPTFAVGDWVEWTDYKGRKHATEIVDIGPHHIEGLAEDLTYIEGLKKISK